MEQEGKFKLKAEAEVDKRNLFERVKPENGQVVKFFVSESGDLEWESVENKPEFISPEEIKQIVSDAVLSALQEYGVVQIPREAGAGRYR